MTDSADRAREFDRYRRTERRFQVAAAVGALLVVGVGAVVRADRTGLILLAIASVMWLVLFGAWRFHMRSYICQWCGRPFYHPGLGYPRVRACAHCGSPPPDIWGGTSA